MVQNVALTTFTSSAIVVYLMQRLKRASWFPLVQENSAKLNRLFSVGAAAIGAMSVEWVWDPSVRSLTIHLPTLWVALVGLWHWLNHLAMQETIYQATYAKAAVAAANGAPLPTSTKAPAPPASSTAPLAGATSAPPAGATGNAEPAKTSG
jgi:energy-converting hydrogenase Eha subunit E